MPCPAQPCPAQPGHAQPTKPYLASPDLALPRPTAPYRAVPAKPCLAPPYPAAPRRTPPRLTCLVLKNFPTDNLEPTMWTLFLRPEITNTNVIARVVHYVPNRAQVNEVRVHL